MFSKKKAYKHVIFYRCKDETKIPKRKNYLICFFKIDKCLHSLCNWHPSMQQRKRLMSLLTKFKNVFSRIFVNNKKKRLGCCFDAVFPGRRVLYRKNIVFFLALFAKQMCRSDIQKRLENWEFHNFYSNVFNEPLCVFIYSKNEHYTFSELHPIEKVYVTNLLILRIPRCFCIHVYPDNVYEILSYF